MALRRRVLRGIGFWLWRAGAAVTQRLPARLTYAVAVAGGELAYLLWREKRDIAKRNFAVVLARPMEDIEVARVARRSFRNFAKYVIEIMRFPKLAAEDVRQLVVVEGWEHLRAAKEHGKGLIFASFHFGNFEIGGARVAEEIPLNVVADDISNQRLMDLLIGNRAHKNIRLHMSSGAAKQVLAALRRDEMVALLMDLGPRAGELSHVLANFFGLPARFPTAAATLARATGAPIVVAAVVRERDNTFRGIALPPIVVERTKEATQDVERATQAIVAQLEDFVRRWPDQWYIFRPMWHASAEPAS